MNNLKVCVLLAICLCLVTFGYIRGYQNATDDATSRFVMEQTAHTKTQLALQNALDTGLQWKLAYEAMQVDAEAAGELVTACLAREKNWQDALEQQNTVFRETSVHPRTVKERMHVVDDATRRKAALMLNAVW